MSLLRVERLTNEYIYAHQARVVKSGRAWNECGRSVERYSVAVSALGAPKVWLEILLVKYTGHACHIGILVLPISSSEYGTERLRGLHVRLCPSVVA